MAKARHSETRVCWRHLSEAMDDSDAPVVAFRRIGWTRRCHRVGCSRRSVALIPDGQEVPRAVCRRHRECAGDREWLVVPRHLSAFARSDG